VNALRADNYKAIDNDRSCKIGRDGKASAGSSDILGLESKEWRGKTVFE